MSKIIVLGAGLVGSAIAIDLNKNFEVTSADKNQEALKRLEENHGIKTLATNLADRDSLKKIVSGYDLVIGAVPGHMGYKTLQAVIEAGKNIVDISFMPEDFMELDGLAKKNGVSAVVDCGVAPGIGNMVAGYYNSQMDINSYECYVGGLPFKREWPYEYKAVFSPIDVIEEYIRPARYVQNYELVIRDALSEPELMDFEPVGTLEAWNSDGLRSLLKTMKIPNMVEKTLRYPGCIEYLKVLRESGFFSYDEIEVNGVKVRPVDVTAKLLFPKWKLKKGEEDFTIMRIIVKGKKEGESKTYTWDLFDRFDRRTGTISMARTTGYTCTAVANLALEGKITQKGVLPPEFIGEEKGNMGYIIKYLSERGVEYKISENRPV